MSSTNRRGEKRLEETNEDTYRTPAWAIDVIFTQRTTALVEPEKAIRVLDAGAGDGRILARLIELRRSAGLPIGECMAIEKRVEEDLGLMKLSLENPEVTVVNGDFLQFSSTADTFDVSVSNPPFLHALAFIEAMLAVSSFALVLGRLALLETKGRREWFARNGMPDVNVFDRRPSFVSNVEPAKKTTKTDSAAYAWFVFHRQRQLDARQGIHTPGVVSILDSSPYFPKREPKRAKVKS